MVSCSDIIGERFEGQPDKEELNQLCDHHGFKSKGFTYPLNERPTAYIKCGATMGEARNQLYALQYGANVPRIYHAFERGRYACILMEYIDGMTLDDWLEENPSERNWVVEQVARAITQMSQFPVPEGAAPGPVGGGHARHHFFRDGVAPRVYHSVEDLQNHMNKPLIKGKRPWTLGPLVDFSDERMLFYYSDIHLFNFMIIPETREIYVLDFEAAGFLPESFMSIVLHASCRSLNKAMAPFIPIPKSKIMKTMNYSGYLYKHFSGRW